MKYIIPIIAIVAAIFYLYYKLEKSLYSEKQVVVIDSCQYIKFYNGRGWSITHKGDCTNEIHRLQVNMKW